MEAMLSSVEFESRSERNSKKKAENRTKAAEGKARDAEKRASDVEKRASEAEATLWRAKNELASARAEYDRYVQVALPAALEDAWRQAVEDFNAHLLAEYKDGMRDMKAGFALTNHTVTWVDWSFVLEMSKETAAEEEGVQAVEEGEVTGAAREPEEVVIIDEPEQLTNAVPDAPASEFTLPGQLD